MNTELYEQPIFVSNYHFEGLQQNEKTTHLISHSSSERRSIFNTSRWSKLTNVTGCFTARIGAQSSAVELENAIPFRRWSDPLKGGVRDLWQSSK